MKKTKIALLVVLVAGALAIGLQPDIRNNFSLQKLQLMIQSAGVWGYLIFLGLFVLGTILNLPALAFVGAAALAFGRVHGLVFSLLGAMLSVTVVYFLTRAGFSDVREGMKEGFISRMYEKVERSPFKAIVLLRLAVFISPPITLALSMSKVRFQHFFWGTLVGILPVTIVINLFVAELRHLL